MSAFDREMSRIFGGPPSIDKATGFRLLRERGAVKAVLSFSGGNDEGGVDQITLILPPAEKNGEPVKQDLKVYWEGETEHHEGYDREKQRPITRPFSEQDKKDQKLSVILCSPVDAKYGSFAGEFSVYGSVTWDTVTEKVTMEEQVQSGYESRESDW